MAKKRITLPGIKISEIFVWFLIYILAILSSIWIYDNVISTHTESYGTFTSMTDNLIFYYQSTSVVLEEDEDDDSIYFVEKELSPLLENGKMLYDANKNDYILEVNNSPICDVKYEAGYFEGKLNYSFRNVKNEELIYDELTIRLEFNQKNTSLKLTTSGGSAAANYWTTLFDCNGLKLNLYEV